MEEYIIKLIVAGYTTPTIIDRCNKKNYQVTELKVEEIRHKIKLKNQLAREVNNPDKKGKLFIFSGADNYFDYRRKLGVKDCQNIDDLIENIQRVSSEIFERQAICLLKALEMLSEGKSVDIEFLYKGYDIAFKVLDKAIGLHNLVDINSAIKCLEERGFKIDVSTTPLPEVSKEIKPDRKQSKNS